MENDKVIFYTHIQKTCGTSIYKIVEKQDDVVIWRRRKTNGHNPNFITGHFPYGLHRDWGVTRSFTYATFIRSPIERWKSQFYHGLAKNAMIFKFLLHIGMGLDKFPETTNVGCEFITPDRIGRFIRWCIKNCVNKDIMAKQLSGIENMRNICKWPSEHDQCSNDFGFVQAYAWSGRYKDYTPKCMDNMVNVALSNLQNLYAFVGIHEDADNEQRRFCETFEFKMPDDAPYHYTVTPRYMEKEWFNETNVKLLEELNKYDIMLYNAWVDSIKGQNND